MQQHDCGLSVGALAIAAASLFAVALVALAAPQAWAKDKSGAGSGGGDDPAFAFVANSGTGIDSSSVGVFSVSKTGALTEISGSPFSAGTGDTDTNWVVLHPNGKFVYVTNEENDDVAAFSIDQKTGALTPISGSPFATGENPNCPRISPSKKFMYVANEGDDTITVFSIDKKTGALTQISGSPFAVTGAFDLTDSIALTRNGRFAYVTDNNFGPGHVFVFAVDKKTGALTQTTSVPTGTNTDHVIVDRQGKFAFAANFDDDTISVFSIDQKTGALTAVPGSPFPSQGDTDKLAISKNGRFLYAANDGDDDNPPFTSAVSSVGAFSVDRKTGALTPVPGSPFVTGDVNTSSTSGVTIDPTGKLLFAANENGNTISVFSIDKKTGALTEVSGSPFTAGAANTEPVDIAILRRSATGVAVSPR